jgi:hypothetical protein
MHKSSPCFPASYFQSRGFMVELAHPHTISSFVKNHGQIRVGGVRINPRHITSDQAIEGTQIIGASMAVEALANSA